MANIQLKSSSMPRYVGAKASVTRTENGIKISMSDYQGTTEEVIVEAIDSITTNADGSLTFTLPDGREIVTDSLKGAPGAYCGETEPTDPDVLVWVDPSNEDGSVLKLKENDEWTPVTTIIGEAAGFGTVSASVDSNHGTPSVTVTATGDDTAKNFAFEFKNLQPAPYDDSVIQARMDSFSQLPSGSTAGDAELIDGRVGADGVTYPNIGGAIRGQITDLKSDKLDNYYSIPFAVLNERINTSGGFSGQTNMARTDYYPCIEGEIVTVKGKSFIYQGSSAMLLIAFYDEGQNFISGVEKLDDESVSTIGTISATAPSGTAYVACSTNSENAGYDGFYARVYDSDYLLRTGIGNEIEKLNNKVDTAIYSWKSVFNENAFVQGGMTQGALVPEYTFRVASYPSFFKFDYPLTIKAKTGYKFGVHIFTEAEVFVLDPGWQTEYVVPENTKFRIVIAKVTEDHSVKASIPEFVNSLAINTKADAEISALLFTPSYYYNGEPIDFKRKGFKTETMFSVPSVPSGTTYQQGFAIYDDVLFQLYSSNKVKLVDMSDGSTITTLDINSDHGDSIDFSNEFYDENDEFPLAYITADTNPAIVYVVRITRSAATLVRTYYFGDLSKTGYYAGHALDSENQILYMVGYTENSYYLDENGTNKMIVSKWDLNDCVTNQDSTLTPTLLDSFTTQFMRTVQGQRYFDNKLFLLSSHNGAGSLPINTTIYVVDPFKKIITSVFDSFPSSIKNNECEAIEFVLNNDIYDMVISNTNYYKLIFG